jgi:hypothetical protein
MRHNYLNAHRRKSLLPSALRRRFRSNTQGNNAKALHVVAVGPRPIGALGYVHKV